MELALALVQVLALALGVAPVLVLVQALAMAPALVLAAREVGEANQPEKADRVPPAFLLFGDGPRGVSEATRWRKAFRKRSNYVFVLVEPCPTVTYWPVRRGPYKPEKEKGTFDIVIISKLVRCLLLLHRRTAVPQILLRKEIRVRREGEGSAPSGTWERRGS